MLNINFVPDDYVQNTESRRTNLLCLLLLVLVMGGLVGSFVIIKVRQRACAAEEMMVGEKMAAIQKAITQFEQLQVKRKEMMKNALTTAELLEPVPRSVLLASLTNNLPTGASLSRLKLIQKQAKTPPPAPAPAAAAGARPSAPEPPYSPEKLIETHIDIEGVAPSDLQVASYIESLGRSTLLQDVALVESTEQTIDEAKFRRFKLTAMLRKEVQLTKDDIDEIRAKARDTVWKF
ncbi:MAG TPA: hypothetical protein ENN81_00010 [Phycisphaerales bacterium]|nr:hypothetical protein [Phycisphaerales bacterium]